MQKCIKLVISKKLNTHVLSAASW